MTSYDPNCVKAVTRNGQKLSATESKGVMAKAKKKTATRRKYTKKNDINRSEAIREYFKSRPKAGPTEVKKELAKKGITVSTALVSNVRARMLNGKGGGKQGRGRSAAGTRPLEDVRQAGDLMFEAIQLVLKAGAKEAKQLVGRAEELVNVVRDKK